ncbi:UNVERIFIED_CONTAM: hypothetical protein PYX00_005421 [Menopon gallinae]|uniref:Uncharacterized protein n=1 Tax=Menopon gallinae TaxID=328185 RepID=A0AAW2HRA6_9NEOP
MQPFAFVSNIHYTGLTDISWSSDGRVLTVSSSEGYCSIIVFEENELGIPYKPQSEGSEVKADSEKET